MDDANKRSPIILTTSSNLLGFCFIVLTSRQISGMTEGTIIDDIMAFSIAVFMACSLLAFIAMRTTSTRANRYEQVADILFLLGLFTLFSATMLVAFNVLA